MLTQPKRITFVAVCLATLASASQAQELRWKLAADDEFSVAQTQTTTIDTRVEKRDSKIDSSVSLIGNWKVTNVSDDNVASIEQTVESIKVLINNPSDSTKSVAIDTASSTRPAKNSRALLKELQPLVGMKFLLKMNDQGEVIDVTVPDETQTQLDTIPTDSWLKALLDPGKLQGQIRSTNLALPKQDLTVGQSIELAPTTNPATVVAGTLGKRKMTYVGQKTKDGKQVDVFTLSTAEKFDAVESAPPGDSAQPDQPSVATFEWAGKLLFDRDAGHCTSCENQTTIKTSSSHRNMAISTTVVVDSTFQLQRK